MTWFGWIALVVLATLAVDRWLVRRWAVPDTADELHWLRSPDGLRIAVWRYRPRGGQAHAEPVLMVHGLGANHRNHAFDERYGLAQELARRGYDCWAVDLRGAGASEVPDRGWSFDAYVEQDLPVVMDHVLATTGFSKLHWVGHSMGGMLFYAMAGAAGRGDAIASAVTLGSPVRFFTSRPLERWALRNRRLLQRIRWLDGRALVRWIVPWLRFLPPRLRELQYNPEHTDGRVLARASVAAVTPVSVRLLLHFSDWIVNRRWTSEDQRIDYRAAIATIRVPTMVVAGSNDRLCPPWMVKLAHDLLPGDDRSFVEAGPAVGFRHGYSHIDLMFGRHAPEEIFPLVSNWLDSHRMQRTVAA